MLLWRVRHHTGLAVIGRGCRPSSGGAHYRVCGQTQTRFLAEPLLWGAGDSAVPTTGAANATDTAIARDRTVDRPLPTDFSWDILKSTRRPHGICRDCCWRRRLSATRFGWCNTNEQAVSLAAQVAPSVREQASRFVPSRRCYVLTVVLTSTSRTSTDVWTPPHETTPPTLRGCGQRLAGTLQSSDANRPSGLLFSFPIPEPFKNIVELHWVLCTASGSERELPRLKHLSDALDEGTGWYAGELGSVVAPLFSDERPSGGTSIH